LYMLMLWTAHTTSRKSAAELGKEYFQVELYPSWIRLVLSSLRKLAILVVYDVKHFSD
jgi:hypothetical protein